MKRPDRMAAPTLLPGQTEYEFGIPIPGLIVPAESWAKTAIRRLPESGPIDWSTVFGRSAHLCLDIGCGNGRFTLASAVERPEWNHVAIDSLPAVIRYATRRANQRGLSHTRFIAIDGWRLLHDYSSDQSWDEIHIYHPQPYADPRKASLRMLNPEFLLLMHQKLRDGGKIFVQTDRKAYWDYIQSTMPKIFDWQRVDGHWIDGPQFRSRREILAMKQGLKIFRGAALRRSDWNDEELATCISELPQPRFKVH